MTQRTEQCCRECSGWEPALHECSCQCHYSPTDEIVVDLVKRLRIKADMISTGEQIEYGSETALMYEAASVLTQHKLEVEKAVREEREAVVRIAECYMNVVDFNNFCEELNEPELTLTNKES